MPARTIVRLSGVLIPGMRLTVVAAEGRVLGHSASATLMLTIHASPPVGCFLQFTFAMAAHLRTLQLPNELRWRLGHAPDLMETRA